MESRRLKVFTTREFAAVTTLTAITPIAGFWGTFDLLRGVYATTYLTGCVLWFILILPKVRCVNCFYFGKKCALPGAGLAPLFFRADSGSDLWAWRLGKIFWPYWYFGVPVLGLLINLVLERGLGPAVYLAVFGFTALITYFTNKAAWRALGVDICFLAPAHITAR